MIFLLTFPDRLEFRCSGAKLLLTLNKLMPDSVQFTVLKIPPSSEACREDCETPANESQ